MAEEQPVAPEPKKPIQVEGSETITPGEGMPSITLNWKATDDILRAEVALGNGDTRSTSVIEIPVNDVVGESNAIPTTCTPAELGIPSSESTDGEEDNPEDSIAEPSLLVLPITPNAMQPEQPAPTAPLDGLSAQITQNFPVVEPIGQPYPSNSGMPPYPQSEMFDGSARELSIPAEKPGKNGKPKKRHRVRNTIIAIIVAILVYEIAGFVLGPIVLPYSDVGTISLSETFGQSTTTSERILYLGNDNEAALDWRLKAIQEAKSELCFESFDFRGDDSGEDLMAAMYAAAERGVHERIIVDGFISLFKLKLDPAFTELYNHPNVEIKFYNMPNLLTPWTINYRLHEKVITVDNTFAIVGGRNSMNYFLGNYGRKKKDDRDILVYNTNPDSQVFAKISRHFNDYWNYEVCTDASPWGSPSQTLTSRWEKIIANNPSITAPTAWGDITLPIEDIDFITCGIEATNKNPTLWKSICAICAYGQSVIIQSPYVMFSKEMYNDLTSLSIDRKVYVVTNDITDHTNAFGTMDLTHERDTILATGVTLVETQWPDFVHAKAFIVDDNISIIGSFNCDSRSAYLDNECMLVIKSKALNEQLRSETANSAELGYIQTSTEAVAGSQYDMQKRENNSVFWTIGGYITHPIRYLF